MNCPNCRLSLKTLKQMQQDHTTFHTATGRKELWIDEVDETAQTIRMERSTGKKTWMLEYSKLKDVHDRIQSNELSFDQYTIGKELVTWGSYATGLFKYLGCFGNSLPVTPVDGLQQTQISPVRHAPSFSQVGIINLETHRAHNDIELIVAHLDRVLPLASARLSDEYYYQSLPLCIIDAVYSIGVRYEGVKNTVKRYCKYFSLQRIQSSRRISPALNEQESVSAFYEKIEKIGFNNMAMDIFCNRQRTSPTNGILKAEAVQQFANVLKNRNIEYLQDIFKAYNNHNFEKDIMAIPGQKSGICLQYFFMLAGSDDYIKPDRMILAFLKNALVKPIDLSEAQDILSKATELLKPKYPNLTPRLLDHEIWKHQRNNMS